MNMCLFSVLLLIAIIALGFYRKINIGLLAIMCAYPLGKLAGMGDSAILAGFNISLFVSLLGVVLLFSIAQENGSLMFLTYGTVRAVGKRGYLLPFILFICAALLSAAGPGPIPVMSILNVLAVAIAREIGCSPILLVAMSVLGASAGAASPITSTGIVIYSLANNYGITYDAVTILLGIAVRQFLCACIIYIAFRGYRLRGNVELTMGESVHMNRQQLFTMIGVLVMLTVLLTFRLNIGFCSFILSVLLLLMYPIPTSKLFKAIPWDTLIMICGIALYINVMIKLGGIDLLSRWISGIMTPKSATAIVAAMAGVMSWFSSTTGVVLPTMIPMIPELSPVLNGEVSSQQMIICIAATAMVAGISPISTGGGFALAAYSTHKDVDEGYRQKLMVHLLLTSAALMFFLIIFEFLISLIGNI